MLKIESAKIKQLGNLVKILVAMAVITLFVSLLKNFFTERWIKSKEFLGCIPAKINDAVPAVYYQSALHPIISDSLLKNFIKQFMIKTRYYEHFDFYSLVENDELGKYDTAKLSNRMKDAIYMAKGTELIQRKEEWSYSNRKYRKLKTEDMNIIFLMDEIITFPVPNSNFILAIVRGQYEGIYSKDSKETKKVPPEFLGYREIRLLIGQDTPELDDDNEKFRNKFGLYVYKSSERKLSDIEKSTLEERSRDYVLNHIEFRLPGSERKEKEEDEE
jgi:hypothetical protein